MPEATEVYVQYRLLNATPTIRGCQPSRVQTSLSKDLVVGSEQRRRKGDIALIAPCYLLCHRRPLPLITNRMAGDVSVTFVAWCWDSRAPGPNDKWAPAYTSLVRGRFRVTF